jgi:hypothetical protein
VAIENEMSHNITGDVSALTGPDVFWGGDAEQYLRLLYTAYQAAQHINATTTAVAPSVKISDGGFASGVWGYCIGRQNYVDGTPGPGPYATLALDYYDAYYRQKGEYPFGDTQPADFASSFATDVAAPSDFVSDHCDNWTLKVLPKLGDRADSVNFHFYEDPTALHYITDFLQRKMSDWGYYKPLLSNEIGLRQPTSVDTVY